MSRSPAISVVMTAFNEEAWLPRSIGCLLNQTLEDIEVVLVDDGSRIPAAEVLAREAVDPRLRIIRQANAGLSNARNTGLRNVAGRYVTFLDADDSRPGHALADLLAAAQGGAELVISRGLLREYEAHPVPFYDDRILDEAIWAARLPPERKLVLALLCEPQSASKLVSMDLVRRAALGFPSAHYFEDIFFHALCVIQARGIAFCDSRAFVYHRRRARRQITAGQGTVRFDAISTCGLTLDLFARSGLVHRAAPRSAVVASVLRLVNWCESVLAGAAREQFHQAARAMFTAQAPSCRDLGFDIIPDQARRREAERAARHYGLLA